MDWSKAKNILIIAFIITNLLLAYVLIDNRAVDDPTLSNDFIGDVKSRLLEKDIRIDFDIPKEIPSLALLTVEYETYAGSKAAKLFLGEFIREDIDGVIEYKKDNETLRVIKDKELVYENKSENKIYESLDRENVLNIAKEFIEDKGFPSDDYILDNLIKEEESYYLEFTKIYSNLPVEKSYMKFKIDLSGIKSFERFWIKEIRANESKMSINSAPRALLRLLTKESAYGKTITEIGLSYYFDPQKHTSSGDPVNTKMATAIPSWRIKFSDGTKEFLEEY